MPRDMTALEIGRVWDIIPRLKGRSLHGQLPNNRYNPPKPDLHEKILYRLLQMLHKRPFLLSRFGPHGTSVLVRAQNEKYLDLVFRYAVQYIDTAYVI